MPPVYLLGQKTRKSLVFQAWRGYYDLMKKEVAETKLAEYENDPRIESIRANPGRMRKHELVELAQKELGLTYAHASNCTVVVLREMIKQHRKSLEGAEDPMKRLPKGFTTMKKSILIAEAKKRGLILDQISADKVDWNKLTNGELQLAIHNHVNYSNGLPTVIPKNKKTSSCASTNVISSDEEFQEVRMEEPSASSTAAKTTRRKRAA